MNRDYYLVVKGEPVTPKQAAEIIIRTDATYLNMLWGGSNARDYDSEVSALFGRPMWQNRSCPGLPENFMDMQEDRPSWFAIFLGADQEWREKMRFIYELNEVANNNICSNSIDGPRGWCHPDGTIHGNYPLYVEDDSDLSPSSVRGNWDRIAKAFPFLDLRAQLVYKEKGDYPKHFVEYLVRGGRVRMTKGDFKPLETVKKENIGRNIERIFGMEARDREVNIEIDALKAMLESTYGEIPQWKCPEYAEWLLNKQEDHAVSGRCV